MEVTICKTNKIISDSFITVVFKIVDIEISKSYNLMELLDKMEINENKENKYFTNYILLNENYSNDLTNFEYSIKFLIEINESNFYLKEIKYIPKQRTLIFDYINKDVRTIENNIPENVKNHFFMFHNFKTIRMLLEIEDFLIKTYYLIPEFYNGGRILRFIEELNTNIDNIKIKQDDEIFLVYSNDKLIGHYCKWDILIDLNCNRLSENYMYMFPNENIKIDNFIKLDSFTFNGKN
jgi:hypothetical protein